MTRGGGLVDHLRQQRCSNTDEVSQPRTLRSALAQDILCLRDAKLAERRDERSRLAIDRSDRKPGPYCDRSVGQVEVRGDVQRGRDRQVHQPQPDDDVGKAQRLLADIGRLPPVGAHLDAELETGEQVGDIH